MVSEPCQFLPWDSDFFGYQIARVNSSCLDADILESIYTWSTRRSIDCLYFLANADDPQTIQLAQKHGFNLVEVRLNMGRKLTDWDPETRPKAATDLHIRPIRLEDIPSLQKIASDSYVDSRYYFDPHFSKESWQGYYATWVKKSCEGRADLALVAEKDDKIGGYITGNINPENPQEGIYELTGVDKSARRSGVGQELFRSGLDWYTRHGVELVWLATQARNIATQRMIQRNGFITRSCQLYYHKWFVGNQRGFRSGDVHIHSENPCQA